jgi:hypothetical protein
MNKYFFEYHIVKTKKIDIEIDSIGEQGFLTPA